MKVFFLFSCMFFFFHTAQTQSGTLPEAKDTGLENFQKETSAVLNEKDLQKQPVPVEMPLPLLLNTAEKQKAAASKHARGKVTTDKGKDLLFYADFMTDVPGAMPAGWLWREAGKVVVLESWPGHWLSLARKGVYAPAARLALPDAFTLEFDLLMISPPEEGLGTFSVSLAAIEEENPTQAWRYPFTTADLYVGWDYSTFTVEHAGKEEKHHFTDNILRQELGRPVHVKIIVKGSRYTLWVDDRKVVDIPDLIEADRMYNRLLLSTQLSKADEAHQVLVSNFRLAPGKEKPSKRGRGRK